jgi:hypothetical protein
VLARPQDKRVTNIGIALHFAVAYWPGQTAESLVELLQVVKLPVVMGYLQRSPLPNMAITKHDTNSHLFLLIS